MKQQACQAESLFLNTYVIFHTGYAFDFKNLRDQIQQSELLINAMNSIQTDLNWLNIINRYRSDKYCDRERPPKMDCLAAATIETHLLETNIEVDVNGTIIPCSIDTVNVFIYPFNTGLLEFKVLIPEEYWQDAGVLKAIIAYVNCCFSSPSDIAKNGWADKMDTVLHTVQDILQKSVVAAKLPLLEVPFIDLVSFFKDENSIQGSHVALVAVLPEGYNINHEHYQSVMLNNAGTGIVNQAKCETEYAYTESYNSLFVMANNHGSVEDVEDFLYDKWMVWMQFHEFSWKMIWDLDRVTSTIINSTTNALHRKCFQLNPVDILKINRFLHYMWLCIDDHHPRNLSSFMTGTQTYYIHLSHYMKAARHNWNTDAMNSEGEKKMLALEKLIMQMYAFSHARRSRLIARMLGLLGVAGIVAYLFSHPHVLSLVNLLGPIPVATFTGVLVALLVYVVFSISK